MKSAGEDTKIRCHTMRDGFEFCFPERESQPGCGCSAVGAVGHDHDFLPDGEVPLIRCDCNAAGGVRSRNLLMRLIEGLLR